MMMFLAVMYLLVEAANIDEVFEEKEKNYCHYNKKTISN